MKKFGLEKSRINIQTDNLASQEQPTMIILTQRKDESIEKGKIEMITSISKAELALFKN